MTRQSIAIDMDEVLADTIGALIEGVNRRQQLNLQYDMFEGQRLRQAMPEHEGILNGLLREPGFFYKLSVMPDAQEVVEKLSQHYDIYIATAAMDVPTSFDDKYSWLRKHFPFLDPQQFVFCGRKNIVKADYLIDDNPKQLSIFTGTSIMFSAAHNANEDRFIRMNNWKEIEDYFLGSK